ncbi:MAG: hypothetical protein AMXMBFR13_15100 [Phycisphaerae bacterium]
MQVERPMRLNAQEYFIAVLCGRTAPQGKRGGETEGQRDGAKERRREEDW